jgi:hypothetical protein
MDESPADLVTGTTINSTPGASTCNIEQMRWSYWRATFALRVFALLAVIVTTAIMFCITKSPLSFTLLSILTPLLKLGRRIENFLFPLSQEDLLLEMSKQTKKDDGAKPSDLFHHLTRKLSS